MQALPAQSSFPTKPSQGHPPKGPHPKKSTALTQLLRMQELLFADAQDEACKGAKRAMITRAWKELQELRLRITMKPPPKPIDVSLTKRSRKSRSQGDHWEEPAPVPPKPSASSAGNT